MTGSAFQKRLDKNYLPVYIVFFFSICYLAALVLSAHEGIFYAGDEGIKSLVVKQISSGFGFKYVHMAQPAWVQSVWRAGFIPLRDPFFYPSANGYIIVFPPAFQIISAFFYSRLGWVGLYIIPLLCTMIMWVWTVRLLKRCGMTPSRIAVALFVLVFCSPLTLYGAMFWEHLPAVLLLFAGIAFIVAPPARLGGAIVLGLISGLAVWLRPEALMMDFLFALGVVVLYLRDKRPGNIAFLGGLSFVVLAFFIFNKLEYGSILGVHGQQILVDKNPETRMGLHNGFRNLVANNRISIRSFFFSLLLIPVVYRLLKKTVGGGQTLADGSMTAANGSDLRIGLLSGIVLIFCLVTPFMLPNDGVIQWGARYFLVIIPVTVVALALAEKQWNNIGTRKIPLWLTCFILLGTAYSFYHNTYKGYRELRWRYDHRLNASFDLLEKNPGSVVVMSHQAMSYDFAYLFNKNYFFAASGDDSLRRLLPLLKKYGVRQYIYMFDPRIPTLPKMLEDSTTSYLWDDFAKKPYIKDEFQCKVYTIQ